MNHWKQFLVVAAVVAVTPAVWSREPNPGAAAAFQTEADNITKQADQVQANIEKTTGDRLIAGRGLVELLRAQAAAGAKVSTAYGAGDDLAIKMATAELDTAKDATARGWDRLNVRQNQFAVAANSQQVEFFKQSTPDANKPLLDALIAARQKFQTTSEALYAAITPEAAWSDIELARDAYLQSLDEIDVTGRALMLANVRARYATRPGADAVTGKLAELTKVDEAVLAASKAAKDQTLQLRILERKRAGLIKDIDAAFAKPAP